jgi:sugar lactone lactonase YvrE
VKLTHALFALSAVVSLVGCAELGARDGWNGIDGVDGADGKDGADAPLPPADTVLLPGTFFPESVNATADGTLYITSIANGSVLQVGPDGRTRTTLIPAEAAQPFGKLGVLVDERNDDLYVCTLNTATFASALRRYDVHSGAQEAELALANGGVCNDLAQDAAGNVYITDSFFGLQRLPAGGSALEVWASNDLFVAAHAGAFAVNGIALDGDHLIVGNLDKGILVQVPIESDGTAGTPVEIAGVTLTAPDGIRLAAPGKLLVAESGADALSEVVIDAVAHTGTRTLLSNRLDRPSSVAVASGAAFIADGQVGRLFGLDPTPVNAPFLVERLPLF